MLYFLAADNTILRRTAPRRDLRGLKKLIQHNQLGEEEAGFHRGFVGVPSHIRMVMHITLLLPLTEDTCKQSYGNNNIDILCCHWYH